MEVRSEEWRWRRTNWEAPPFDYSRKSTFLRVNPYVHRSAGPQEEGALMCSKGTNLGPAQQSSAGLLHFERWEHAE